MLRRGRELRGPLSTAAVPARASRNEAFRSLAHDAVDRVASRAGLEPQDWTLRVQRAPDHEVEAAERWGQVLRPDARWQITLHRLALEDPRATSQELTARVEAVVAELLGEALGMDPDDLTDEGR